MQTLTQYYLQSAVCCVNHNIFSDPDGSVLRKSSSVLLVLTGISVRITADNGDTGDALRFVDQKPLVSSVLKKSANPPDNRAETLVMVMKPTEVYHIIDNQKLFKLDHGVGCAYC